MSYSFLRESKLYIVYGGNKYRIYTSSAITFNQTFAEESYSVKTLHDQSKMFEGSSITKANPASFSFDVPLTIEKEESPVLTLASDLNSSNILTSFDMYIQTGSSTFKLEGAVITSASFDFVPQNQVTMRVEGEGKKLTRVGNESYDWHSAYTAPSGSNWDTDGSNQLSSSTRTPLIVYPVITLTGKDMSHILSINLNIQNEMTWTPYETLHDSLDSTMMFPSAHTVEKRIISGEIRQYQTDNNVIQFDDFSTDTQLTIKAIKVGEASNATPFFQIAIDPIMFTARMQPTEVYTQSYDFRSLRNTDSVSTQITQYI
ncbi:hypothetical protein [Maricaulis sp.]|uniref:hypothetical protein n=1 Tax=Maricaulis sp. TaxID=1486257 RepID=UPI0025BF7B3F|nr:hypothetical protein [Maricaulis sp.]